MVTSLTTFTHHRDASLGPWNPAINETVTISKRLYARLVAADLACQQTLAHVAYQPIRNEADVYADWARRDAARDALSDWARLAAVNGGPR